MIISIQLLRAYAAIAVAVCHFSQIGLMLQGRNNDPIPFYPLAHGVDLFFIVSGFIMVHSSVTMFGRPDGWKAFLHRRLIRIVPLYWATTIVWVLAHLLGSADYGKLFSWNLLISSLLFFPAEIYPIYGVGWTLNYEMFFYTIFAASICCRREVAVSLVGYLLCTIVIVGYALQPTAPALRVWSDPIVIEFVFGMAFALLYQAKVFLPPVLRIALVVTGFTTIWLYAAPGLPSGYRFIYWGIPSAFIFAGVILGQQQNLKGFVARAAKSVGDASYAIYLLHTIIGAGILMGWSSGLNRFPMILVLACGLCASVVAAICVYRLFEAPVKTLLGRQLQIHAEATQP